MKHLFKKTAVSGILYFLIINTIFALPPDINESNRVDGLDLILFSRVKGAVPSSPNWLPEADVNKDEIIDEKDLEILTKHFARKGIVSSIWVADYNNNQIVKLSGSTGKELLRLGGSYPSSLGVNLIDGSCWIANNREYGYGNNEVVKLDNQGKELFRISGFSKPQAIAVNWRDGSCWVGDSDKVIKLSSAGQKLFEVSGFANPRSIDIDFLDGSCWIADYNNRLVVKMNANGVVLTRKGGFIRPISVSVNQKDGSCWVADQSTGQIIKLVSTGTTELLRISGFYSPYFVSVNSLDESVWIADRDHGQVVRLDKNGSELVRVSGFNEPNSVRVDPVDGGCWVSDSRHGQVVKLSPGGKELIRKSGFYFARWVAVVPEEIKPDAPQINVSVNKNHIAVGEEINFNITGSDTSGVIEKYELDFNGDGVFDSSLDTSGNISHIYESVGIYNPVLKARNDSWLSSYVYKNIIRVGNLSVKTSASPVSGNAPLVVNFSSQLTDPLDGRVENYQWDFDGDGLYDFLSMESGITSYTYKNAGIYRTVLKVTDTDGSTASDSVTVTISGSAPMAKAGASPIEGSHPLTVNLSSSGSSDPDGSIVLYQWDFNGDSTFDWNSVAGGEAAYTYNVNMKGVYKPLLKVTDNSGLTDSSYCTVKVNQAVPIAQASAGPLSGNAPLAVNFAGTGNDIDGQIVNYEWKFGNGALWNSETTGTADYTYNTSGVYTAIFKATDNDSSFSTASVSINVFPSGTPLAAATASPVSGAVPLNVSFTGTGTDTDGQIVKYEWDFGDQNYFNSDSSGITDHIYNSAGIFKTVFKVKDNSGFYSTANVSIKAQVKPLPSLKTNINQGNVPLEVSLQGAGNDPDGKIVKYEIDLEGDNIYDLSSSTNINIDHIYQNSGIYNPTLKVTDNDGYFNTVSISIAVDRAFPFVQLSADPKKGSSPHSVSFKANSSDRDGFITLYEWDFNGDSIYDSSSSFDSLTYIYDSAGNYQPKVRVTDNDGLTAVSSVNILVNPTGAPLAKIYASPAAGSVPLAVYFSGKGTDLDGTIAKYEFDFDGDGFYDTSYNTLGINDSVQCVYNTAKVYSAGLKVTDNDGLIDCDTVKIFASSASLWAINYNDKSVIKLGSNGKELKKVTGFVQPYSVSVNPVDGSCWIGDVNSNQVIKLDANGTELFRISGLNAVCVSVNSADGSCWVANYSNNKVAKISSSGEVLFNQSGFYNPLSVSVNITDGSCWVSDYANGQIVKLSSNGTELCRVSGFFARSVSVNSSDGCCWVSDVIGNRIVKLSPEGQVLLTVAGMNAPYGLAVNPVDGSCWIADRGNNRIVRVDSLGKGILAKAGFNLPWAVSPDIDGGCWAADTDNAKVVKLSANGTKLFEAAVSGSPTNISFNAGAYGLNLPSAAATVAPLSGDNPLTANFSAGAADTSAAIINYEWDFEGDGIYDFSSPTAEGASAEHTYSSTGIYNPVLRVTNSNGLTGFDYKNIARVGFASINISLDPISGKAPLKVNFISSAFSPNGLIAKYEWDFNGDGIYDWSSSVSGNTSYTYNKTGKYQPVLRVTDQTGTEFIKNASEINVTKSDPVAVLSASPASGARPLNVIFQMSASYDPDGSIALYELDYNNDGVYDWNTRIPNALGYIYNSAGIYNPVLRVTDNEGLFSTAKVTLTVNPVPVTVTSQVSPVRGKAPLNVSFSGAANSDYPIASYVWNFGDGNNDSAAITNHTYNSTGNYKAILKATDSTGAFATTFVNITVLSQANPSAAAAASPVSGDTPLRVNFSGSGIDTDGTIIKYEWDFDGNGTYDWNSDTTGAVSYTYNSVGTYNAVLRVRDDSTLTDTAKVTISAGLAPSAFLQAYPLSGNAPLDVTFTPIGTDSDGSIYRFEIDFDGNGTYDYINSISDKTTYNYKIPGIYKAKLKVTDYEKLTGFAEITIEVKTPSVPQASASASPAQGIAPLSVSFSGLASDLDGTIKRFEWDFQGDGLYDFVSDSSVAANYVYESVGAYKAVLKVTDNDNNFNTSMVLINVTSSRPPQITASANPLNGNALLKVVFTASAVDTTAQIIKYEWDFDGDGTYDFSSDTTGNAVYTYTLAKDYTAALRVTNSNNASAVKTVSISVNMGISAVLSKEGFDPTIGENISINSVLTQPAKVTLRIVDRNQNPVRAIISNVNRETGFYSDNWNGRDDSGNYVKVGLYYFIIDYEINGKAYSYNLTNTSGDYQVMGLTYPVSFSAYDGKLCNTQYTVEKASEINICIWNGLNYIVKTMYMREPRKSGTYVTVWDGTNDEGLICPPGPYVMLLSKWVLAKNAIIVSGRPVISDFSLSTGYFSPDQDFKSKIRMGFSLSKPVKLKVLIKDSFGNVVNETEIPNLESGLNYISWNGVNKNGYLVSSGDYSLGVQAIDAAGNTSNWMYGVVKIFY